jgi:preprotein translocase SecE subunit
VSQLVKYSGIQAMAAGIYKRGQGYWTRQMTTIAGSVIILLGALWLAERVKTIDWGFSELYAQAAIGVTWTAIFGLILYHLVWRKPRSVDFLVATEGEMKKVNWSTRQEVVGSTVVVIMLAALIALFCKVWDILFAAFFISVDVLDG